MPVLVATVALPVLPEVAVPVVPVPVLYVAVGIVATVPPEVLVPVLEALVELPVLPEVPVPVLVAPVNIPVILEEVIAPLAPAAVPVAPRVALLVPLPRGWRSRISGTLKVVEPSPMP